MRKKEAIFVRSNPLDRDIRLPKEIASINKAGYSTKHIYWDRDRQAGNLMELEDHEAIPLRLKAPWGTQILLLLPVWWSFVFVRLLLTRFDVVHAVNLDSIIPCIIAAKLKGKPVVYEILDVNEELLPRGLRTICLAMEKFIMRWATSIIVADEEQIKGIGGIPNRSVVAIYDSPPDYLNKRDAGRHDKQVRGEFTLFYAGQLYRDRRVNLDKAIEAIKEIEGVRLVVAGYGDMAEELREVSARMPGKIEFIGQISYEEVIRRGFMADLFFVLRDPTLPFYRYICGSTLFNAMICGKPILVNQGTSTTKKVSEENCGLAVNANDIEEIRRAILKLRDNPQLCEELGTNARIAYEQRYSWEIMEQRLVTLYHELLREVNSAR